MKDKAYYLDLKKKYEKLNSQDGIEAINEILRKLEVENG